jgi:DNA-binding NarL/FixJ family response regulator
MSSIRNDAPIRVGLLTDEPLRMEGFIGIFDDKPDEGSVRLSPVFGDFEELLSDPTLMYLVVDLNAFPHRLETVEVIRRRRPDMRLIVIGPEGDDKLIIGLILAGVRAYLDLNAVQQTARKAIEVVISGSIWAPRRLLSQLIDKLLSASDTSPVTPHPHLTDRERQVLELILTACPNHEIARRLGIEESTVQAHVGRLLRKTGAENRIGLLMGASNPALLEPAEARTHNREEQGQKSSHSE